ncbi:MAG: DUF6636 domain-containing protein [Roseovarius sp.]
MPLLPFLTAMFALLIGLTHADRAHATSFSAPSGNIICYTVNWDYYTDKLVPPDQREMNCLVFEADWTLPPYYGDDNPNCDLDRTRAIILPPNGPAAAQWFCHGDVFWPLPNPKIAYGSDWSVSNFACTMREDGVRCQNASGHGFHVRRSKLTLN